MEYVRGLRMNEFIMSVLTKESLENALTKCYNYERLRIGIFFSTENQLESFIDTVAEYHKLPGVKRIIQVERGWTVEFYNNSTIDLVCAKQAIFVDEYGSYDQIIRADNDVVIQLSQIPTLSTESLSNAFDETKNELSHVSESEDELDKFLNSFLVNKV